MIEVLERTLDRLTAPHCPPRLARAIHHAVLAGGARLRPRVLIAVAHAAGQPHGELVDAASAAIELLHCASLVHDDLPCFDDAPTRRGSPSVQAAFGEATAVLAGDALIFGAFNSLLSIGRRSPEIGMSLLKIFVDAAGVPYGMTAGQAWENETQVDLERYHQAKTASLFEAATLAGALIAGDPPEPWRLLGRKLGEAYQILDDFRDVTDHSARLGKPARRDAVLGRPNIALRLGMKVTVDRFAQIWQDALTAIPSCPRRDDLKRLIGALGQEFLPQPTHERYERVGSMEGGL